MCKAWTYDPQTSECSILSSCEERDIAGVLTGIRGCEMEPRKTKVYNRLSDQVATVDINWENPGVCPGQQISVTAAGFEVVKFYDKPEIIDCGKASLRAKLGSATCTASNVDEPTQNLFINSKSNGNECAFTLN